ncbi:MAG TPA: thioredoxin family protein [Sedimentisphaerales bacterium]|nr:thioredoxin family protein [Sedimentisphaerales bacterium]
MNRIVISMIASWTILALASTTLAQSSAEGQSPTRRQAAASSTTPDGQVQRPAVQRQEYARLQQQIDELKAAHQDLVNQLQALHAVATQEKAKETAGQIQTLIGKRQEAFQSTLRQLEQQQQQLQRPARTRPARTEAVGQQTENKQAPDFALDSFDGRNVRLSRYKGRVVVLEWINPDCPFSRYHYETTPTMANLAEKYKNKEVVWLAINSTHNTTPEANRQWAEKHKLPFPILDDRSGLVGKLYGARTTPHMFVIDQTGAIAYEGAIDNAPLGKSEPGAGTVNYVDKAVSELLAGKKVGTPATPPYGCTVKYGG